tara:strand:- start:94 stop:231 length:138 start_codon:yes stop_codon:yes gene_type:complete
MTSEREPHRAREKHDREECERGSVYVRERRREREEKRERGEVEDK